MKIIHIGWKDFRNLAAGEITPAAEINVIFGENAQGKTNLLEGIWLFTGDRSFRGAKDADLVRRDQVGAVLDLGFQSEGRGQTAKIRIA